MKRIFIAIRIMPEESFEKMFWSLKSTLGNEKIKWVNPDNIHLTLVFLGDTGEEQISAVSAILAEKCIGFGDFSFSLCGTGIFKNLKDPRVLWIGVRNHERLAELAKMVNTGLIDTGFKIEERQFSPHITIGRIKFIRNPEALKYALETYKDTLLQDVHAREVILYESILKPEGPFYRPISKFNLK